MHLVKPLLRSTPSLLRLTEAKVSLSLVAAWTAEAKILQNADKLKHVKLRCLGVLCLNMWHGPSLLRILPTFDVSFGSCLGTFDAGKAARGRCCRFSAFVDFGPKICKGNLRYKTNEERSNFFENWDEIAEKRKNWNTRKEHSWYSFEDLVFTQRFGWSFCGVHLCDRKANPWMKMYHVIFKDCTKHVPNRLIVDTWSGYLSTCEMRASSSRPCTSGNSSALF